MNSQTNQFKGNLKARLQMALNNIQPVGQPYVTMNPRPGDDLESEQSQSTLNDRVYKLQDKINSIQYSIEQGKTFQIEEYEQKVMRMEDKFDDIIDTTEKRFDVLLNEQLHQVDTYLNKDRISKQEQLRMKKQAIADR